MSHFELAIDRSKPLRQQPHAGHNRWHPEIPPALTCDAGDTIRIETNDAFDNEIGRDTAAADVASVRLELLHPLTGPIYVNGAEPGDTLRITTLEVEAPSYGYTVQVPGFGFLRDAFPEPFIAHWEIANNWAVSDQIPNVRIPGAPFPGTFGLAPSMQSLQIYSAREAHVVETGGVALPPDATLAVPEDYRIASSGLRTIPPRENGGNFDIRQLTAGSVLDLPVQVPGGLYSVGDLHFAQGDCEVCGTAIEIAGAVTVKLDVVPSSEPTTHLVGSCGVVRRAGRIAFADHYLPENSFAATGFPVNASGQNLFEDVGLAARNALVNLIELLVQERDYTHQQAYTICSVAAEVRLSQLVDLPNVVATAFLPLGIFES